MSHNDSDSDAMSSSSFPASGATSQPYDDEVKYLLAALRPIPEHLRGRRMSRDLEKAAKRAQITAENQHAISDAEAAGCHVRDFATEYATSVSGEKSVMKE
ncbi:hypothetical protein AYL99_05374 [Fonsecaea erecta]|uniref:Uncharacterized protein n=1 Tax=Fonsecaea erecta TaxID=1367422 RepID=A0A178ZL30_9EURO|nr:hypothetical protein AYL99_05374 [Fonsecaea erecta]OAP60372.1 hypothetical protein AYL99_05374 [Fonsecaea erecta]